MTLPDVLVGVCHTGLLIRSDRSVRPKTLPLKSLCSFAVWVGRNLICSRVAAGAVQGSGSDTKMRSIIITAHWT